MKTSVTYIPFSFLMMVLANDAHAYLDPGTGSFILQGLIAGLAALSVITKLYWHRLKSFLGFRSKSLRNKDNEYRDL